MKMHAKFHRFPSPLILIFVCLWGGYSEAQNSRKKAEIKDPETVVLVTKDQVELRAEWFPGKAEKSTVPIILLHDWDGSREDLLPLANYLHRQKGFAVLVPDLRGHGDSLSVKNRQELIDRDRFRKNDFVGLLEDIESCKRFLISKNDEGELNIDLLTIGAVGKLAPFAVEYSLRDWTWQPLAGVKQRQDMKAIVMISPEKKFKSSSMTPAFRVPLISGKGGDPFPIFLTWGTKNSPSAREGQEIFSTLERSRPTVKDAKTDEEQWQKQTLFRIRYNSDGSGKALMEEKGDKMFGNIGIFIEKKVADRKDEFRWQSRKRN